MLGVAPKLLPVVPRPAALLELAPDEPALVLELVEAAPPAAPPPEEPVP